MSNEKSKTPAVKGQAATAGAPVPKGPAPGPTAAKGQGQPGAPASASKPPAVPARVPPLFRRIDWLTFLITFGAVWLGYYLTLAPELTLEDSGELATGSFYAGIPHPPGYPVWTIYTWLWTVLLPIKNIAWRVALAEATGGAVACGLLGLLVSRGSSLMMEGIEDLKSMTGHWESAICMVSGFVAGMLVGFNGFMWSQSVIVEVYAFSVASLMIVFLCLLRWIYAPHQWRYLFLAWFFHGVCFTNHQTLIVAAIGIEVAIAAASFKMGRNLFLWNSITYFCGLILVQAHILTALEANHAVFVIFNVVGIASALAYFWFSILSKETFLEFCRDATLAATFLFIAASPSWPFFWVLALCALIATIQLGWRTRHLGWEWFVVLGFGLCWLAGASFYFYMPLAGMSDPPMMWGYPRTIEGFIHAFTRGQYEKANPTNIFDPHFLKQLALLWSGIKDEFNLVYAGLALVPFAFFFKLHRRERAWMIGITAIYLCLGVLLLILLNPGIDRAAQELNRVFFTASHTLVAMLVGYGITLVAAYMATHYQSFRTWGLIGGSVAIALALYSLVEITANTFFGEGSSPGLGELFSFIASTFTSKEQYGLPVYASLILIGMGVLFVVALLFYRDRAPLGIALFIFAIMPLHSIMVHWSDNEQSNHWFGYWFGHDMFTPPFKGADGKPLYPEMTRNAVLYGGTDPGRFCPTYMIFCDSFVPSKQQPAEDQHFDRRDVYIITQNALADGTYLNYIRAQFNRSTQKDPPFFGGLIDFLQTQCLPPEQRDAKARGEPFALNNAAKVVGFANIIGKPLDKFFTDLGDRIEKNRRTFTSWFKEEDFIDLPAFTARLRTGVQQDPVSKFIYDRLSPQTQQLLSGKGDNQALRRALVADLNRLLEKELVLKKAIDDKMAEKAALEKQIADTDASPAMRQRKAELEKEIAALPKPEPLYTPERFKQAQISEYVADFIKENPQSHTRIRLNRMLLEEAYPKAIARSLGGVYPDREIYSATPDDSQKCFSEYLQDAQKRLQHDSQFPNEPRQIKPGEDVHIVENRVQVSGQVAVMAINGLITKVMFDHNPKNEFFVEESFPLDWMYPHLTPFGIIMKINRQPLAELSEDAIQRDHDFWKQYSKRLTGDIVDYDTPVKDIAAFIERVYLHRNYRGFHGDRRFVRDDQAQKAFSKLRSSIGGIYAWRIPNSKPNSPDQARMIKEADFAFKQAFAFCPYSPEAVFRYVNLLLSMRRFEEALTIASTCLKLDPNNGQVLDLVNKLQTWKKETESQTPAVALQAAFNQAAMYLQAHETNKAIEIFDLVLNDPKADASAVLFVAQRYAELLDFPKLESALEKLVKLESNQAEAWYDLAALKASLGKAPESLTALSHALDLSAKRRTTNPAAADLVANAQKDPRFAALWSNPEFKKLLPK